jgi:hypothetical protein
MAGPDIPRIYFDWLYDQVKPNNDITSQLSFTTLCNHMHSIAFKDLVNWDANRIVEAGELRKIFLDRHPDVGPMERGDILFPDISIFEVLVALSEKANFMLDYSREWWFSKFIENLDLGKYNDVYMMTHNEWPAVRKLRTFNDRSYKPDGRGGLFPLKQPDADQREVELWYQMAAYATENGLY